VSGVIFVEHPLIMKRHKIKICWIIYFLNNPICIVNEVKTLVLILLLLLKIQEKHRDCLQNIDSKMSGFVCLFFVAEIYPDLAFSFMSFLSFQVW